MCDCEFGLIAARSPFARLPARELHVTLSHAAEAFLNPWRGSYAGGGPKKAPA